MIKEMLDYFKSTWKIFMKHVTLLLALTLFCVLWGFTGLYAIGLFIMVMGTILLIISFIGQLELVDKMVEK